MPEFFIQSQINDLDFAVVKRESFQQTLFCELGYCNDPIRFLKSIGDLPAEILPCFPVRVIGLVHKKKVINRNNFFSSAGK